MTGPRFTVIPAVYIIVRKTDRVLLIRRANTGYHDGSYALPAGHVDGGESAEAAAIREVKEEVGLDIAPEDMHFVHVMHRVAEEGDHERVDFFFEARKWQGEPKNMEPEKCDDIGWFKESELPENTVMVTRLAIENAAKGTYYSHHNF